MWSWGRTRWELQPRDLGHISGTLHRALWPPACRVSIFLWSAPKSWGSRTPDSVHGAVPASRDVTIYVWIKGKLKLILTVQGDLWGLAFFFFFPDHSVFLADAFLFLAPHRGSRYWKSQPCPSSLIVCAGQGWDEGW